MAPHNRSRAFIAVSSTKRSWVKLGELWPSDFGNATLAVMPFALLLGIVWIGSAVAAAEVPGVANDQAGRPGYAHTNRTVLSKLVEGVSGWGQCLMIVPCAEEVDQGTESVPLYWDAPTDAKFTAAVT